MSKADHDRAVCASKARFPTYEAASHALARIAERAANGHAKKGWPVAAYECQVGDHWHLTSKGGKP